jgi:hypothetical protein
MKTRTISKEVPLNMWFSFEEEYRAYGWRLRGYSEYHI